MTSIQRKLLIRTAITGSTTTILVLVALHLGWLQGLEDWFYDRRVRDCQFFNPPPTDKLVHVDIDDNALDAVGKWPWPRKQWGPILDELKAASPKAMAMDIVFTDPDGVNPENDAILADAMKRFGSTVIAASLSYIPRAPPSAALSRMIEILTKQPDYTIPQIVEALHRAKEPEIASTTAEQVSVDYANARDQALFNRIYEELAGGDFTAATLRAKLMPNLDQSIDTPLARAYLTEYSKAQAVRSLMRYSRPMDNTIKPLLPVQSELPPLKIFADAAGASGFVDYLPSSDGVVRLVPLWINHRGRMYPQMSLALACLMLGTDPSKIEIMPDHIIIPASAQGKEIRTQPATTRGAATMPASSQKSAGENTFVRDISIPVHDHYVVSLEGDYSMFMDVPWFGPTAEWLYMYDFPNHQLPLNHVSLAEVWNIVLSKQKIESNNKVVDTIVADILQFIDGDAAEAYAKQKRQLDDFESRKSAIRKMLEGIKGVIPEVATMATSRPSEIKDEEKMFVDAYRALSNIMEQNPQLAEQLQSLRGRLKEKLQDKALLVGWTASSQTDMVPTSLHAKCPGVVVHGVIFNAIMTGEIWRRGPGWIAILFTVLMGIGMTAAVSYMPPGRASALALVTIGSYTVLNGIVFFDYGNMIVGMAGPTSAAVLTWFACTVVHFVLERAERARITSRFRNYVDPALVNYVLKNPDRAHLEGEERELTVVFTDLAGFTTLSESLREGTIPLLNKYMELMVPIIKEDHGYVNKFLGDGIMFFYGAPEENRDHAIHAVATVLRMQEAMVPFNADLTRSGLPTLKMRIGMLTGHMVVGDAGSRSRSDYTVLGDAVNTASRLEAANKYMGTPILCSERTWELAQKQFLMRPVGRLVVMGKTQGVMTYQPLTWLHDASDAQKRIVEWSTRMFELFKEGRFPECLHALDRMDEICGHEPLTTLYRKLCQEYLIHPPSSKFDGRIVLESK